MPDFSRLSQALAPITFALTLAGCNTTTDTSYEPETQLSDGKVVEVTQINKSDVTSPHGNLSCGVTAPHASSGYPDDSESCSSVYWKNYSRQPTQNQV